MTDETDDMPELDPEAFVCGDCLAQPHLKSVLEVSKKKPKSCALCGRQVTCLSFETLLERCERVFCDQYDFQSQNPEGYAYQLQKEGLWERPGDPVETVLQELGFSERTASLIQKGLFETYDDYFDGDEYRFDDEAQYTEAPVKIHDLHKEWRAVETELVSGSRYFNKRAEAFFERLLDKYQEVLDRGDRAIALRAGPATALTSLWRARVYYHDEAIERAMIDPGKELGPPPRERAAAGRMNAEHVSVFYGAIEKTVALAEVRPPVGARVMLAKFDIQQPIALFDLSLLEEPDLRFDPFDNDSHERVRHALFLRELGEMLSRPVLPGKERSDYIITQAFCEFVAQQAGGAYQGLVFESAQNDGAGRNVVLFNNPQMVARLNRIRESATLTQCDEQDEDGHHRNYYAHISYIEPSGFVLKDAPKPVLHVDGDSLEVHDINAVEFKTEAFEVKRTVESTPATEADRKREFDDFRF